MKRILLWIQQSFEFSQREAHGFVLLIFILLLFIIIPYFIQPLFTAKYDSYVTDKRLLDSLLLSMKEETVLHKKPQHAFTKPHSKFSFNPNFVSRDSLLLLGFTSRSSNALVSYRSKGGLFKTKKDVSKIYGIDSSFFSQIKNYILLPDSIHKKKFVIVRKDVTKKLKINSLIDINTADTIVLKSLNGIGSMLSKRIVKFREKLGGFVLVDQLQQVYGMDSLNYQNLKRYLMISKDFTPAKIPINEVTYDQLSVHPYCSKRTARQIINYRKQHDRFDSIDDIKKIREIDTLKITQLRPYLQF